MPLDQNGVKWSCEPCVRGHRSSKCEHYERIMVRVKKPGRPLANCPHPPGECSCKDEKMLMVKIQTNSGCICEPRFFVTPQGERIPVDRNGRPASQPGHQESPTDSKPSSNGSAQEPKQNRPEPTQPATREPAPSWPVSSWSSPQQQLSADLHTSGVRTNGSTDQRPHTLSEQGARRAQTQNTYPSSSWDTQQGHQSTHGPTGSFNHVFNAGANAYSQGMSQPPSVQPSSQLFQDGFKTDPLWNEPMETAFSEFVADPLYDTPWIQPKSEHDAMFQPGIMAMHQVPNHGNGHQEMNTLHELHARHAPEEPCACGDGCRCYACTTHPFNETTTNRLKEIQQILDHDLGKDYAVPRTNNFGYGSSIPISSGPVFSVPAPGPQALTQHMNDSSGMDLHEDSSFTIPYQQFVYHFEAGESFRNTPQSQSRDSPQDCCCGNMDQDED